MKIKGGRRTLIIAAISIAAILIILGYFLLFYTKNLETRDQFDNALFNCERALFTNDGDSAVWEYKILGEKGEDCRVQVTLLSVKQGITESKSLEGESMICKLPLRFVGSPESEIKRCSGVLKESIQELMISKLHSYITSNIEQIGKELSVI